MNGIALDGTHVYWTELDETPSLVVSGLLGRVPKIGGGRETVAAGWMIPSLSPASDDGGVYYSELDFDASRPGLVLRFDTTTQSSAIAGASGSPAGMFSDRRFVYWTDEYYGVFAAPLDGGATIHVAATMPNAFPMGLVVVKGVIYWAEFGAHAIRSIDGPAAH